MRRAIGLVRLTPAERVEFNLGLAAQVCTCLDCECPTYRQHEGVCVLCRTGFHARRWRARRPTC